MRLVLALTLLLAGCNSLTEAPGFRVTQKPPDRRDVIEAVLASQSVPLSVSSTCANVGTRKGDLTIGAYLSGFLAEQGKLDEKNAIETRVTADGAVWRCEFTVRHAAGEDEWGWGVRFDIRQDTGEVVRPSFVCTGGG